MRAVVLRLVVWAWRAFMWGENQPFVLYLATGFFPSPPLTQNGRVWNSWSTYMVSTRAGTLRSTPGIPTCSPCLSAWSMKHGNFARSMYRTYEVSMMRNYWQPTVDLDYIYWSTLEMNTHMATKTLKRSGPCSGCWSYHRVNNFSDASVNLFEQEPRKNAYRR